MEWAGQINRKGYGVTRWGASTTTAHRAAWITVNGPLPDDLTLDHLCRNRLCVNLDHLEPVTTGDNTRRAPWTQVTSCPRGHPLSGANLKIQIQNGYRKRSCLTSTNGRGHGLTAASARRATDCRPT